MPVFPEKEAPAPTKNTRERSPLTMYGRSRSMFLEEVNLSSFEISLANNDQFIPDINIIFQLFLITICSRSYNLISMNVIATEINSVIALESIAFDKLIGSRRMN